MRNLKRALSLALAFVMVMSLMIVGTSAKSYTDSDKIENQAAVEVLGEIGVMVGNDDGTFAPDRVVTRAEMAVILTRILYGNNMNVDQFKGLNTFTDVPDWAEGFVNLCASLDIIAGRGNGIFDPDATVTTAEAALMLSRALGYFKNNAEFGNDWALAAVKRATQAGIIGGDMVLAANDGLTRDDVAQMTFNTLTKAVPVQYNELLNVYYNENKGITYALTFYYTDTLGYTNFNLVYRTGDNTMYGRPATTWGIGSYKGASNTPGGSDDYGLNEDGSLKPSQVKMSTADEIITVAETPDYVYTTATKQKDVYNDIGKSIVTDNDWNWVNYVDGAEVAENRPANVSDNYALTGNGAQTEVYVDNVNDEVTVVEINYYLGEVTRVKDETITVTPLSNINVNDRTFNTADYAVEDLIVFTRDTNDDNDYVIAEVFEPATVEGVVKEVRRWTDEGNGNYLVMEDKSKHTYSDNTAGDLEDNNAPHPTLDTQYRLYEDPNGYVLGFEPMEDVSHNYLYVEDSDIYMSTAEAKVTFADGTTDTITLDDDVIVWNNAGGVWTSTTDDVTAAADLYAEDGGLKNHVFAYTVDDGVYTLTALESKKAVAQEEDNLPAGDGIIKNDVAYITADGTRFIVDEKTAFVDVMDHTLYTGYSEVPNYDNAKFWVVDHNKNGVATVVFVYDGDKYDENAIWFYVDDATDFVSYDKNDTIARQHAWIDGEETDVLIKYDERDAKIGTREGLYKILQTNDDGVAIKVEFLGHADASIPNIVGYPASGLMSYVATSVGSKSFFTTQGAGDTKDRQWIVDDETVYVVIDEDGDIAPGTFKDIQKNPASPVAGDIMTYVTVVKSAEDNTIARLIYIVQVEVADYRTVTFTGTAGTYSVTNVAGTAIGATESVLKGDNLQFKVATVGANKLVSVTANGKTLTADASGVYTLYDVTGNITVNVTTVPDLSANLDLDIQNNAAFVTINDKDYLVSTDIDGFNTGDAVRVTVTWSTSVANDAAKFVKYGNDVLTPFSRNGNTDVYIISVDGAKDLVVTSVDTYGLTLPANVTAIWSDNAAQNVKGGSAVAGTTTQVPENAVVTLSGDDLGSYYKVNGGDAVSATETITMDGSKTVDANYIMVTVDEGTKVIGNADVTLSGADSIVKKGTGSVTVTVAVTGKDAKFSSATVTIAADNGSVATPVEETANFTSVNAGAAGQIVISASSGNAASSKTETYTVVVNAFTNDCEISFS